MNPWIRLPSIRGLKEPPGFLSLWLATGISQVGSTLGALSLTALLYLHATPAQMGVLMAATTTPALVVALAAGVWIDRVPRRNVMLFADFGRFALLLSIPIAALIGELRLAHVYVVGFLEGALEVTFTLAYRAILPTMVPPNGLVEANAKLRGTEALAQSTGPAIGGGIVQAAGGPVAVFLDALSFLGSGFVLTRIKEQPVQRSHVRDSVLVQTLEGLRTATSNPSLRAILGMTCLYGFFGSFVITLFAFRVLNQLGLSPLALGLIAVAEGLGSLIGARLVGSLTRALGLGPCIVVAYGLAVLSDLIIPLAGGPPWIAFSILFTGGLLSAVFYVLENVSSLSLRQAVTPPAQMGRTNSVFLVVNRSLRPVGAIVAGVLAGVIGVQLTLLVGVVGMMAGLFSLLLSPLPRIRTLENMSQ